MSQAEDMDALNRFFASQHPQTEDAAELRDEWILWHDGLSWWSRNMDSSIWDQARNRRNKYNLANATTREEYEGVKQVMKTGLTTEEIAGGTKRTLSSGMYAEPYSEDILTTKGKVYTALGITGVGLLFVARKYFGF